MSEPKEDPPFQLPVYSRRYGHYDYYRIRLTPSGWHIEHLAHNGNCDPTGHPILYDNFSQDYIRRPPMIDLLMRSLWQEASSGTLSREQIQQRLNAIGAAIEESEKAPRTRTGRRRR
jgi:hypothetical protein